MKARCILLILILVTAEVPAFSDEAKDAYKQGVTAESHNQCDLAFESFQKAYKLRPKEPKYVTAYLHTRTCAALDHIAKGVALRDAKKLPEAAAEFQRAGDIDPTNFVPALELRRTLEMIKKEAESASAAAAKLLPVKAKPDLEGPVDLSPSPNTPISLRLTTTADNVYRAIGRLGGINVLFDLDYKPQRISIELNEVMLQEALRMVALESKTFWRPISPTAIFVSSESKRKESETNVMRTFYLRNTSTSGELQEVVGTLKGILDLSRIQVNPTQNSITIRGTPDQLVLADKMITDEDKPKSEVLIDIAVLQISRDRVRTLGTTVPTTDSISVQAPGGPTGAGSLVKFGSLNGGSFVVSVPSLAFTALMSDSNSRIIQKPQLRALDNQKSTLKIGDRIPIATGSYSAGVGGGSINALVNTQFQYIDVGVNIDITPHIHSGREVTLKMVLEISSKTGEVDIGGVTQPIIGQRRIEHETRLQDGELNLVGGILEDTETTSMSGYPWISSLPILKYLFGQTNKQRNESEIVFAIMPHIVRAQDINEDNEKLIDVGTGTTIGLRYKESNTTKAEPGKSPADQPVTPIRRRQPAVPPATKTGSSAAPNAPTPSPPAQ